MAQAAEELESAHPQRPGIDFPALARQLVLLIGVAASVAAVTWVVLWSQQEPKVPLYANLSDRDVAEISTVLRTEQFDFEIDPVSGAILIAADRVRQARIALAAQGLPNGASAGMEMLHREPDMGVSQFLEAARYNHALEAELARSVATLSGVESARVHLALPKQSIFIRQRTPPSASVLVKLFPGRALEPGHVAAIVHMVSSSIPHMESSNVTVVDQSGKLLTDNNPNSGLALTAKQFSYQQQLEQDYAQRILRILEPIIGSGGVHAQVTASMDFTARESTQENYDPEQRVIRSEQINEEESRDRNIAIGIPGALTNQPPGAGTTDDTPADEEDPALSPANQSRSATRNYEIDRVISHTRPQIGVLQRLAVALVIDQPSSTDEEGNVNQGTYDEQQMARFEGLVKEAIGFNEERGDTLNLLQSVFVKPEIEALPELPIWQQPWVLQLAKQALAVLAALMVLLLVARPMMKAALTSSSRELAMPESGTENELEATPAGANAEAAATASAAEAKAANALPGSEAAASGLLPGAEQESYEQKLALAQALVSEDPKRAASLVMTWMAE